jgi:hypothetical protein
MAAECDITAEETMPLTLAAGSVNAPPGTGLRKRLSVVDRKANLKGTGKLANVRRRSMDGFYHNEPEVDPDE